MAFSQSRSNLRVKVRPCTLADLSAVADVDGEVFGEERYSRVSLRQAYDLGADLIRVAEADNGRIVGYTIGAVSLHEPTGWILALAVSEEVRARGIGRALTGDIVRQLADVGVSKIRLTVAPENGVAMRLYEHFGFELTQFISGYFGHQEDRFVMDRAVQVVV
jgi:ribosomal protein S18 acetylase RimI-like enzyme